MNKVYYYIIIIILSFCSIFLTFKLDLQDKIIDNYNIVINKKKQDVLSFEQNFLQEIKNENLKLNRKSCLLDIEGNRVLTTEIFKKNSVVLRYSEMNCNDCIQAEIDVLLQNKSIEVLLIADYHNKRDLFVYYNELKKRGLSDFMLYNVPVGGFDLPIEKINKPFYFCVSSDLKITNIFIPQKNKPKLSESYLITASKNFLGNK